MLLLAGCITFGRVAYRDNPDEQSLQRSDKCLVVLDLAGVDAIDAAGLGEFIFLRTLAAVAGNALKLINLTEHVRDLWR